ncbi:hypothetical protein COCC4DRAFT_27562 [Bipolaris maydis ATCC 48331]|uniref:Pentatricopeptide repeat domain-containing protein n=2 Tax=Cochliobolus heterostrophus TaxID=5016 RepID=M2V6M6_COCH5|nr:uncharacterized protein COCC4DRAFT_27562 [Bipolaris maydis ATCC 48331]EMD95378.1 hypothetical protein COCHEDRAFT_1169156 [Bipolaris maydis C5]KAH7551049.1 hypothetical protein BM1_09923 [Bipolaris maydis]ENI00524.1 hypothetical protein COCC4DRAFT_27562 [Bipolaris maydis ATCC 48331]KAJ5021982.1 hypothetical protein J3E73DRAFT_434666 [Bipolaris maydis]KAJ5055153.1 hypothetical protein J3E74DRAFT_281986 [Bipolaris maydis]
MPPALDRLLASPSALRLLRSIVNASEFPAACSTATKCCSVPHHRNYSNSITYRTGRLTHPKWKRMKEAALEAALRESIREALQNDDANDAVKPTIDIFKNKAIPLTGREDDPKQLATVLAYEERINGAEGVRNVWRSIRYHGYSLPTEDTPDAEFLWGTFIKHHRVVTKAVEHAGELLCETGKTFPRLYSLVISHWLPRDPRAALKYHHALVKNLHLKKLPLRELARSGRLTFKNDAYEVLREIYEHSYERDLYDEVVTALIDKRAIAIARHWHMTCTERGDMPSESVAAHPVVRLFTVEAIARKVQVDVTGTRKVLHSEKTKYNEKLMRRLSGPDTAPVRFEDSFVARMFATRTFPPASVIHGLSMVGVNEIGPLAVLTMARQTQPIEELQSRFEELRVAGIVLQGCVFSLALEKFVSEQRWELVRSIVESDQHPDVFGDAEVQRTLLDFYLEQGDRLQAQRTLAILTLFHNDPSQEAWNLLLQTCITRTGPEHVMAVLQDMRAKNVILTPESIMAIKGLLRRRSRGHRPVAPPQKTYDDLRFVTRTFMMILEMGMGAISPLHWREIIRRFGMEGRLRELRRLLLWLLCWYAPRSHFQFATLPKSPFLESATTKLRAFYPETNRYFNFPVTVTQRQNKFHPVRQIFQPSLIQGLIRWGFRAGLLPNATLEQNILNSRFAKKHYRHRLLENHLIGRLGWSIGLQTVVQLRDLGVYVHYHTVLKVLQEQFIIMFGRGHSRIKENRIMERVNTRPYAQYIREVNKIWGSPLFREPQLFASGMIHHHMWHPRMRRNINRKASINLVDILGPDWRERHSEWQAMTPESAGKGDATESLNHLKRSFAVQAEALDRDPEFVHRSTGKAMGDLDEVETGDGKCVRVTKVMR